LIELLDREKFVVGEIFIKAEGHHIIFAHIRFEAFQIDERVRAMPSGERKIETGRSVAPAPFGIARITKIVVTIDETKSVSSSSSQSQSRAEQNAAIASEHEWKNILLDL
jgi:hypothetical protein